ncbi:MAG: hypothetical protein CM15mP9_0820 [Methanobacteriota archaeon]|nr:MAG: hypothetical protein CM15mP9_0820 [Euryarchaeota archaeon]
MLIEIYIHDLETNLTKPLTADGLTNGLRWFWEEHYVYQQMDSDGDVSVEVQQKEPTLQPYSSNILKFGVMLVIALSFINIMQRQKSQIQPP